MMKDRSSWLFSLGMILLAVVVVTARVMTKKSKAKLETGTTTVAEVQAVHAPVTAGGLAVRGFRRVSVGAAIETGPSGRARARLDDGTSVVVDGDTEIKITPHGLELMDGRVFVSGTAEAHTQVAVGPATAVMGNTTVAFERSKAQTTMFCASGELTVRDAKGAEQRVRNGETARIDPKGVTVSPEAAFDDWTGGMAAPWSAAGKPRRCVGEMWGRLAPLLGGDLGSPLALRAMDVKAHIHGEVARTDVRTTYFNAGAQAVQGDFRMAIPRDATVAGFALERQGNVEEASLSLAHRSRSTLTPHDARLEWAGEGWLRGWIPQIMPGATVTVVLSYYEWLSPSEGRIQYRYPLVGEGTPPRVGEFLAQIDLAGARPLAIHAGQHAVVSGSTVTLRRSDFVPQADIVVEASVPYEPDVARAFVSHTAKAGEDDGSRYLVVRAELPKAAAEEGIAMALVLDQSGSVDPALLDAERALAEAILRGLSEKDRVVVFAADETASPVGPDKMGPVTPDRRKKILEGLGQMSPGGATDLGRALERAADAIPPDAPSGLVLYVGDGWPTVGDVNIDEIETRLARRRGGAPRLGAVAVGPLANRFALARLVRSSGPVLEIADRSDAARLAVDVLAEALRPAVAGVEVLFPPGVDRIYPRGAHAVPVGGTVQAVARVTQEVPRTIQLRWRDAKGPHVVRRSIEVQEVKDETEVRRRWALARVQELAFRARGREAATSVAVAEDLLTPWTAWVVGGKSVFVPTPVAVRALDLSASYAAPFTSYLATPKNDFGTLTDPLNEPEEDPKPDKEVYLQAIRAAGQRIVAAAGKQIRACRDSRAAQRPDLSGDLRIQIRLDQDGAVIEVTVEGSTPENDDATLNRCAEVVVAGLRFPPSIIGGGVEFEVVFTLPPPRSLGGRKCSPVAALPTPLKRGIWLERLVSSSARPPHEVYLEAKRRCELRRWTDKRVLLELILDTTKNGVGRVEVARELALAGEEDAANLLRREALGRAQDPQELWAIRIALVGDEKLPLGTFRKEYRGARTDEARLEVVKKFLNLAPHHSGLRRKLFALLVATGRKEVLVAEVGRARRDPLADAALLAEGASFLRKVDLERDALRTYGELAERAPHDPSVRAFLGDRLRDELWFDSALSAYSALEQLAPNDPATLLRLALAHSGAKRIDISTRLLDRLAQTGGRTGDRHLGNLGARLAGVLIVEQLGNDKLSGPDRDRLQRRTLDVPWPSSGTVVLIRTPRLLRPVESRVVRGPKNARSEMEPDLAAPGVGMASFLVEPEDAGEIVIQLRRPDAIVPEREAVVRVDIVDSQGDLAKAKLVTHSMALPANGKKMELAYDGSGLAPVNQGTHP